MLTRFDFCLLISEEIVLGDLEFLEISEDFYLENIPYLTGKNPISAAIAD